MTKREIISQVKDLFKEINADSRLTNKQVWSLLLKYFKMFISRENDKLKILSSSNIIKEYKCVPVIQVSRIECKDINIPFDCKIRRTKDKLPSMLESSSGPIIVSVTSLTGKKILLGTEFGFSRRKNNPWIKKVNSDTIYSFYSNGYLYFPDSDIELVNVNALFSELNNNDSDLCNPCKDCEKKCSQYLDQDSNIPSYLEAPIVDAVLKELSSTYIRLPEKAHHINKNSND